MLTRHITRMTEETAMKKTWQTPQLIALTRSKPEEAVLTVCKTLITGSGTPAIDYWVCEYKNGGPCILCSNHADS